MNAKDRRKRGIIAEHKRRESKDTIYGRKIDLKERLESGDYISALRELGIKEAILNIMEAPCTLTEEELEEVTKWEDG